MPAISTYLTEHHRHCDDLFAEAENAASEGDWETASTKFAAFRHETELHFEREEKVMFPAFESATGMTMGPTQVMRMEHRQMREVFAEMAAAVAARDADQYLGLSETLLMLMQQHNMKEEQILYPMADDALNAGVREVIGSMQGMTGVA